VLKKQEEPSATEAKSPETAVEEAPAAKSRPRIKSEGGYCGNCGKLMNFGDVLCVACGWDKRTGNVRGTATGKALPQKPLALSIVLLIALLGALAALVWWLR
jgi:hypothetical protein